MTLCVYGAQPLNKLKALTGQYFNEVPDKRTGGSSVGVGVEAVSSSSDDPASAWWGKVPAYLPQECASVLEVRLTHTYTYITLIYGTRSNTYSCVCMLLQVVPINDIRRLSLAFPVPLPSPQERERVLRLKPEMILSHLLGHEGKGESIVWCICMCILLLYVCIYIGTPVWCA